MRNQRPGALLRLPIRRRTALGFLTLTVAAASGAHAQVARPRAPRLVAGDTVVVMSGSATLLAAPVPTAAQLLTVTAGTGLIVARAHGAAPSPLWLAVRWEQGTAYIARAVVQGTASGAVAARTVMTGQSATPAPLPAVAAGPAAAPATHRVVDAPAPPQAQTAAPAASAPAASVPASAQQPAQTTSEVALQAQQRAPSAPSTAGQTVAADSSSNATRPKVPAAHRTSGWRALQLGLLGSVTLSDASSAAPTTPAASRTHVAGQLLLRYALGPVGVFAAPQLGQGAGYRSTMLGGGATVRALKIGPVDAHLAVGYTSYGEKPVGTTSTALDWSMNAVTAGGIVGLKAGPVRLLYRGEYVRGVQSQPVLYLTRHAVGVAY